MISIPIGVLAGSVRIVIAAARGARAGWAEAAASLHARGEDDLLDTPTPAFDAEEWEWR